MKRKASGQEIDDCLEIMWSENELENSVAERRFNAAPDLPFHRPEPAFCSFSPLFEIDHVENPSSARTIAAICGLYNR